MRRALLILSLAVGCGSTEPTDETMLEQGRYILTSFDGEAPPAILLEVSNPENRFVRAIEFDTVFIESATQFRRVTQTMTVQGFSRPVPDTTWDRISYSGEIQERDGAFLLIMSDYPYNIQPVEVRPVPGAILRRLSFQELTCQGTPSTCQVVRQGLADAKYERR